MARTLLACAASAALACGGGEGRQGPEQAEAALEPSSSPAASRGGFAGFRGIWVLCEGSRRTLEDPSRIDLLIEHSVALGVSDLFVQVYRSGRAWYDASLADATPYRLLLERTGTDGLRHLLERAHAVGIRVHAWVNVLSLNANRAAPVLQELGDQAVLVDRRGRSLLDYPDFDVPKPDRSWYRMGTPGIYLDPAAPGVRERLVATFAELLARYPELDGLHLDYTRHPGVLPHIPGSRFGVGLDFGYGRSSRERFRSETGLAGPYRRPESPQTSRLVYTQQWDDWRRAQVSRLVSEIRTTLLAEHVDLLISAAVIGYADRAYLTLAQDWRGWLADGLVDFAVPMLYTLDDGLLRHQIEALAAGPNADRIWMGIGAWLFESDPKRAVAQLEIVRGAGSTGEAIFSYDALTESPALLEALIAPRASGP